MGWMERRKTRVVLRRELNQSLQHGQGLIGQVEILA
jgi:hypothetical protein